MRFQDKVVLITGGSAGMGKAAALGFAREGAIVVINSRNENNLLKASEEIRAVSGRVMTVEADVTQSTEVNNMTAKILDKFGKIDILFNYVGGEPDSAQRSFFIEQNEEYWDKMIDINLKSTVLCSWAVLCSMIE